MASVCLLSEKQSGIQRLQSAAPAAASKGSNVPPVVKVKVEKKEDKRMKDGNGSEKPVVRRPGRLRGAFRAALNFWRKPLFLSGEKVEIPSIQ